MHPQQTNTASAVPPQRPSRRGAAASAPVEDYPLLVRFAYLVLPSAAGRGRRVLAAHALVQRVLAPSGSGEHPARGTCDGGGREGLPAGGAGLGRAAGLPRARQPEPGGADPEAGGADPGPGGADPGPGYAGARERLLRHALRTPRFGTRPPWLLPRIWGLRVLPHPGGCAELALDQRLAALSPQGRAACVLRGLDGLDDAGAHRVLAAAGAGDPAAALAEADGVPLREYGPELFRSPEFDACSLRVRPPDLARRRRRLRTGAAALAAAAVCGLLLGPPGSGGTAGGGASGAAVDPARLVRAAPAAWETAARRDFSVWPARGALVEDTALLRRALQAWASPGEQVTVSAAPGTASGPPSGPARLLFAGEVGRARVVLLHDGLRAVRYSEPLRETSGAPALDFARTDAADAVSAAALVVGRAGGRVRYLTAPWVREVSAGDLLAPGAPDRALVRDDSGVTAPLRGAARGRGCSAWPVLAVRDAEGGRRLLTDLGELTPARLTFGPPDAPADATGPEAGDLWARTACALPGLRAHGVREVNAWAYARQRLPEANGTATWLCTRAETWRGDGVRVSARFQAPGTRTGVPAAVVAEAEDSPACGARTPRVLAGVMWRSRAGQWYALAAGGGPFRSVALSGGVRGEGPGPVLAVRAPEGVRAEPNGVLADGTRVGALR